MTKEELKKEAQEQVNCCTPLYPESFIQGYLAGAEPRENKIADIKANCDLAIEGRDIKIKELEKENSDLKNKYSRVNIIGYDALKNLTKAKKIIELFVQWNYGCCKEPDYKDIVKQAEQFLKEIEK